MLGDALEVGVELRPGRHRPGRVVRRRDVDELRARADRSEQSVEVVVVVDERHLAWDCAELERVEHVADEGRPRGHDLVPGIERREGEVADQRVGSRPCDDVRRIDVVALGERAAKVESAAVGVAVEPAGAPLHRLQGGRERAPRALVRRELDDAIEAELALDLLLRLPRLVRNEAVQGGAEEASRPDQFSEPAAAGRRSSCGARTRARRRSRRAPVAIAPLFGRFDPSTVPGTTAFALCFSTRLRADPREPAEHGVPPVEDAHARRLTSLAPACSGHVPGTVPGTRPKQPSASRLWERSDPSGVFARTRALPVPLRKKASRPLCGEGAALGERRGRRAARPLCGDEGTSLAIEIPDPQKPCATSRSCPTAC